MKKKTLAVLAFCCFIFSISFGQDRTNFLPQSGLKFHLSVGGAFLKNIETDFPNATGPFIFVEGGVEVGQKFNAEFSLKRVFASADTLNLNFSQIYLGLNNKSRLTDDLFLVLKIGGGISFFPKEIFKLESVNSLRIGTSLEQRFYKDSVFTFNMGYDISNNSLFSGLMVSAGLKVGFPSN